MMELGENELERLLIKKSFEELSFSEREYVLKYLSEEEYINCHVLLSESVGFNQQSLVAPSSDILKNLKSTFSEHKKAHSSASFPKNHFRNRLMQSLAVAAALLVTVYLISRPFFSEKSGKKIVAVKTKPPKQIQKEITPKGNNISPERK